MPGEFMRRLKHQLMRYSEHHKTCHAKANSYVCNDARLIARAITDSWVNLKSLGYAREGGELVRAVVDDEKELL